MAIRPTQLKIANVTHGDLEIFPPIRLFEVGLSTVPHNDNEYTHKSANDEYKRTSNKSGHFSHALVPWLDCKLYKKLQFEYDSRYGLI